MIERYNYKDIIRYFYLNPEYKDKTKANSLKTNLQNSFSILYIATNELFSINNINGNNTFRLLSYEEINSLNTRQWEVLVELLGYKYKDELELFTKKNNFSKDQYTKWISSLLISLSQFDKINREQQALLDKGKFETSDQSITTSLKVLKQVVNNLDISNLVATNTTTKIFNKHIQLFSDVMEVLENIQLKNFVAASRKTLSIIDNYSSQSKSNIISGSKGFDDFKFSNGDLIFKNVEINKMLNLFNFTTTSKVDSLKITFTKNNYTFCLDKQQQGFIKTYEKAIRQISDKEDIDISKKLIDEQKEMIKIFKKNSRIRNKQFFDDIEKFATKIDISEDTLINSIALYLTLIDAKNDSDLLLVKEQFKYLLTPNLTELTSLGNEKKYTTQLLKLSEFFGDVLSSSNSEELASVIESHALPPTSYKLKRKMNASIDLNAYVGGFGGYISRLSKSSTVREGATGGLTAPIGVTFKSIDGSLLNKVNLHVQILELGNLVNHYIITPSSAENKNVHFTEVFSPGIKFLINISNTPIVYYIGASMLPLKAYSTNGEKNEKPFDVAIFSTGFKIDIPLLNRIRPTNYIFDCWILCL